MFKALALENFWAPVFSGSARRTVKKESAVSFKHVLAISLIALNSALAASYIYGVNAYASQGYEMRQLEAKLSQLNDENKKLTLQVSQASSMTDIKDSSLGLNFVPAGTPKFLNSSELRLTQR